MHKVVAVLPPIYPMYVPPMLMYHPFCVRGRDLPKIISLIDSKTSSVVTTNVDTVAKPYNMNTGKRIQLDGVYFPLLAMLLLRWESSIQRKYKTNNKSSLFYVLVSSSLSVFLFFHSPNNLFYHHVINSPNSFLPLQSVYILSILSKTHSLIESDVARA